MIQDEEFSQVCETILDWTKLKLNDAISFEFPNSIDLIPPTDRLRKHLRILLLLFLVFVLWKKRPELFQSLYQILTLNRGSK